MAPEDELVSQWVSRADDDLALADLALDASPPVPWGAAFHAQQAAEKFLKALLTHHRVEFEKVHSIDYLVELGLEVEPELSGLRDRATTLTDFAVEARYPLPRHEVTEDEAAEAVAIARQVRAFALSRLPGTEKEPRDDGPSSC